MKKILTAIIALFILTTAANAKVLKDPINSIIMHSGIDKSSVAISVKDLNSGKTIYKLNENILMHPASVQKILTLPAAIDILGEDYEFKTKIYTYGNCGYLVELGADPYLSSSDLKKLVKNIDKGSVKKIYIDDSIIEAKDWGEGWQWDDDLNTSMPRFNSYNLDKNLIKITVMPDQKRKSAIIINPSKYPLVFINNVKVSDKTNVKVTRNNVIAQNALTLEGTVNTPVTIYIPTNNLKGYFYFKLTQALADKNIYLKLPYTDAKASTADKLLYETSHPISITIDDILKNSNNMAIETVLKLASAKAYGTTGTDIGAIKIFNEYCEKIGIDSSRIRLVDASGVSKNNLTDADFITEYLYKNKKNVTLQRMATSGEGTLSERMIPLQGKLKAKTGTLSDISAIAGYLTTQKGKNFAFCIIINDPKSSNSDKKTLEDYLIREFYTKW